MDFLFFDPSFMGLLLLAAVVVGIAALIRRAGGDEIEPGIGTTRRLFLYGLALVALMLATTGVTLLAVGTLETITTSDVLRRDAGTTAFGLAATIVGFPMWALLWRAANRSLERYPAERGTLGRKLYVYSVLLIGAAVVAGTLPPALRDLLGADNFEAADLAAPLVWAALWAIHWRWEFLEGQPSNAAVSLRRLYVYLTSSYGLGMLAFGTGFMLAILLGGIYDVLFGDTLSRGGASELWRQSARASIAAAVVGAIWWWFHWHRVSRDDRESDARRVALYLVGVFGGMIAAVIGASIGLFAVLEWILDRPELIPAARHFDVLPGAFAAAIAGGAVWAYHGVAALDDAKLAGRTPSAGRAYRYLSAAVGLATLSAGLTLLLGVVVGLLTESGRTDISGDRPWGIPLAASFTLLFVGAGLWGVQWLRQQNVVAGEEPDERLALSRRAYLYGVFGVAVLATLIALSIVLFRVLEAALESNLSSRIIDDVKWAVGVVVTAGLVSAYHWQVLREDRLVAPAEEPSAPRVVKQVTAAAPEGARGLIDALAERIGARTTFWGRRDEAGTPTLTAEEMDHIAEQIAAAPGERVLLVVDGDGVRVIPV